MWTAIRLPLAIWRRFRFRLWVIRLRLRLRHAGGRLRLNAPYGAILDGSPRVTALPLGTGDCTLTLSIGRDVRIGRGFTIELWAHADNELTIGDGCLVLDSVRIMLRSGRIVLGRRCNIRDGVWLKSDGDLLVGDDVPIAQYSAIHCSNRIELDDQVGLAERVSILDSDHTVDGSDTYFRDQPLRVGRVHVARNTFIAAGSLVLRDAAIGKNSLVAANSIVRAGAYPDSSIIAGAPATVVRALHPEQDAD